MFSKFRLKKLRPASKDSQMRKRAATLGVKDKEKILVGDRYGAVLNHGDRWRKVRSL